MIKLFLTLIAGMFLFSGCCNCGVTQSNTDIPAEILEKANSFVISKSGKDFFESYIKYDKHNTIKTETGYLIVYNFSVPDKPGIKGIIRFNADEEGNVIRDKEITGIPDCLANPDDCVFGKSKEDAIRTAYAVNFKEGIKEWDVNFIWSSRNNKYVWEIRSTLEETKVGDRYKGHGLILLIDPGSGNVIDTREWRVN
jgi:hypothetical protein